MAVSPEGRCALLTKPVPVFSRFRYQNSQHLAKALVWLTENGFSVNKKSTSKKAASNDAAFSVILL